MKLRFPLKPKYNLIRPLKMDTDKDLTRTVQLVTTFSTQFVELMELLIKTYVNSESVLELTLLIKDHVESLITNLTTVNALVLSISTQFVVKTTLLIKLLVLPDVPKLKLSTKVLVLENVDALLWMPKSVVWTEKLTATNVL